MSDLATAGNVGTTRRHLADAVGALNDVVDRALELTRRAILGIDEVHEAQILSKQLDGDLEYNDYVASQVKMARNGELAPTKFPPA